jgi:hypothetical protein
MVPVMPQSTTPFSSAGTTSPRAMATAEAPKPFTRSAWLTP